MPVAQPSQINDFDSEDETLMPGGDNITPPQGSPINTADEEPDSFDSEDETLMPGSDSHIPSNVDEFGGNNELSSADDEIDSEDETLMPNSKTPVPSQQPEVKVTKEVISVDNESDSDDETIMPGQFEFEDDDATIRKDSSDYDASMENFIDLGSLDEEEEK